MVTMADIAESLRSVRSDHVAILSGLLEAGAASMSYHAEDLDYRQDFDARRGHDDDASEYDEPLAQLSENAGKIAELLSAIHGESKPPEQLTIDGDPEPCTWDGEPLYAPETVREGLFQPEAFEQIEGQTALATDPQVVAVVRNRVRCGQEAVIFATRDAIDAAREWAADCEWLEDPEQLNELGDCAIVRGVDEHHDGGWTGFVSSL